MIKTILVPMTATAADARSLAVAAFVARAFNAHIEALHVQLNPVDVAITMAADASGVTGAIVPGLIDDLEQSAHQRAATARQAFDAFCAREALPVTAIPPLPGVASAEFNLETGQEDRWLDSYARTVDLVVGARGTDDDGIRTLLETVLMGSGRPLLIADNVSTPLLQLDQVVIAWKSTPQTGRAVTAALPLLGLAKGIAIVTVDEGDADPADDADQLLRYLGWHGLKASVERLHVSTLSPVEALLEAAQRKKAGLLVMGGYGHSRLREWVFGGFTSHVLADAPLPVLIAH